MYRILCYGDSNTNGCNPAWRYEWPPEKPMRFTNEIRWTRVLERILGTACEVIEEGLPGRTTVYEDEESQGRNGLSYLLPCIQSHQPLDLIVLMLGTNDLKKVYRPGTEKIAGNLERLMEVIQTPGNWTSLKPPHILVVAPAPLGEGIVRSQFREMFDGIHSVEVSKTLGAAYEGLARKRKSYFIDASLYVSTSKEDSLHLDEHAHRTLAQVIAEKVKEIQGPR